MKKVMRLLTAAALCSLLAAPAAAEALPAEGDAPGEEPAAEAVLPEEPSEELDLPDMIIIEDEEVPLSALPLSFMDDSNGMWNARTLTLAGLALMGVSALGMVIVTYLRGRESIV